ncbi:LacI family DNA-binding transcriptional regulator [Microlunatus parietis]|uniref:DNA-binding LacI/PurR family transcriptional regulator n=1 Tax=Microlunatus parietis TaxID=682979 RepID=A0A7Y9IEE1_9ACTN|nr:LacI family DNA-binding transcriptional regulator [Microlunatus parietis]NYE74689.1 DNA-binding LacI/PurR family transcriptional regulator [Microlunatus parietis]
MARSRMRDIAERLGISEAAVSFALNGKPGVSDELRSRVRAVAEELNWRPHAAARALADANAHAVGLVLCRDDNSTSGESFFIQFIAGLSTALESESTALVLQIVPAVAEEVQVYRRWWNERRVDAVVVLNLIRDDPRPDALAAIGCPAVLVAGPYAPPGHATVSVDDAAAMHRIVAHLVDRGHRCIGHVGGPDELDHAQLRRSSLSAEGRRAGIQTALARTDYTEQAGYRATRALLRRKRPPTAIVFDNEILALAGISAITEAGLRVPDDIAVVSWEDGPICRLSTPQITALDRSAQQLGRHTSDAVLRLLGRSGAPATSAELDPELLIRASSAVKRLTN